MSGRPSALFSLAKAHVPEGFPGRVDFVKSGAVLTDAPDTSLPEVAFCGRSNVGKSSLINTLCNRRQLARVSNTPGRTRLINFFDVQQTCMFVDLPGYGFAVGDRAEVAKWGQTIQEYLQQRKQLVLSLLLVDARRKPQREEEELHMWFQATGLPSLVILTKCDKLNKNEQQQARQQAARIFRLPVAHILMFSALSRAGREDVWGAILSLVEAQRPAMLARLAPPEPVIDMPEADGSH
jgi:GTP-binding protein